MWRAVAGAFVLAVLARDGAAARPVHCAGRYVVRSVTGTFDAVAGGAIVLGGSGEIAALGCAPARVRWTAAPGVWRIAVRWRRCGPRRNVRLRARVARDCSFLRGVLVEAGAGRGALTATASACGDAIVDRDGGEMCDDGNTLGGDTCEPTCVPCDPTAAFASTWEAIQATVVVRYDCTRCHGSARVGGLDLRPEAAYANLVGVPSAGTPALVRVNPGDARTSLVWLKLAKATLHKGFDDVPGGGMPLDGQLAPDELDAVARWIDAGAPRTGLVPGTEIPLSPCRPRAP